MAEPGVYYRGYVAGAGQVPFGDGLGEHLGGVQASQLGGAQGAPQPAGLVAGFGAVGGWGGRGGDGSSFGMNLVVAMIRSPGLA